MERASWQALSDLPHVRSNSGNWAKAEIAESEGRHLFSRLMLSCIQRYIESFPNIVRRRMNFSYYSYTGGDCLLTHDDTDEGVALQGLRPPTRRIAVATYLHEEWESDWDGELIIYNRRGTESSV